MATFYVLPPREFVGKWFAGYLESCFPGLDWSRGRRPDLAGLLLQTVADEPDVFVIHREELPEGEPVAVALTEGFGAEAGDEIVEVHAASTPGKWMSRRWRLAVQPAPG